MGLFACLFLNSARRSSAFGWPGRVADAMATSSALSPFPNKIRSVSNATGAPAGLVQGRLRPVVVLQEVLGSPWWHPVLPIFLAVG